MTRHDAHTKCRCGNLRAEGTVQDGPEPQLQYKRQCCRRKRVNGCAGGGGVKEAAGWGEGFTWDRDRVGVGQFPYPHPALGKGVKPHLQMGFDGVPRGVCLE